VIDDPYAEQLTAEQREALAQVRADLSRGLREDTSWRGAISRRQLGILGAVLVLVLVIATVPALLLRSNALSERATARADLSAFAAFERGQGPKTDQVVFVQKNAVVSVSGLMTTYALSAGGQCLGVTVEQNVVSAVSVEKNTACTKH